MKVSTGRNSRGKDIKICALDKDTAPLVKEVFEKYVSGNYLKVELFKEYGDRIGIKISAFEEMFKNRFYAGMIYVPATKDQDGYWHTGKHQPLIDHETFLRVQAISESRGTIKTGTVLKDTEKTQTQVYYLKGILKCDLTGGTMTAYCTTKKRSGQAFLYYQTAKSEVRQVLPVEFAHQVVGQAVSEFVISDGYRDAIIDRLKKEIKQKEAAREKELEQLHKTAEQCRSRILNMKLALADGNITAIEYREVKEIIGQSLTETNISIRELEMRGNEVNETMLRIVDSLTRLDFIYKQASPERKRELLMVIFPEGFSIDKASGKVRTGIINYYLSVMCNKSGYYDHIINKKGLPFEGSPVVGGEYSKVRTEKHLYLLKKIA